MAGPTRLELATSGVTGRRSNQLNYDPAAVERASAFARVSSWRASREGWWAVQDSNL
jgi:hypothetical protein